MLFFGILTCSKKPPAHITDRVKANADPKVEFFCFSPAQLSQFQIKSMAIVSVKKPQTGRKLPSPFQVFYMINAFMIQKKNG